MKQEKTNKGETKKVIIEEKALPPSPHPTPTGRGDKGLIELLI